MAGTTERAKSDALLDRAKFFREHIQAILTLATGSFVLSITFLHDIATKPQHADYLKRSWAALVVTILLGVIYNYVLSVYVRVAGKSYGQLLSGISALFHLAFLVAIYYMLRFGMVNF